MKISELLDSLIPSRARKAGYEEARAKFERFILPQIDTLHNTTHQIQEYEVMQNLPWDMPTGDIDQKLATGIMYGMRDEIKKKMKVKSRGHDQHHSTHQARIRFLILEPINNENETQTER